LEYDAKLDFKERKDVGVGVDLSGSVQESLLAVLKTIINLCAP
jgi:hypothetical protein